MAEPTRWWLRNRAANRVYGPVSVDTLIRWAREGRLGLDDEVSSDGQSWVLAAELGSLGLEWWVEVEPDRWLGPLALSAIRQLCDEQGLGPDIRVRRGETGTPVSLDSITTVSPPTSDAPCSSSVGASFMDEARLKEELARALGIPRRALRWNSRGR